jgi:type VI secretion system protein ImpG
LPHSIISITGIERNSACRVSYEPLYHFSQNTLKPQRTYTTRYEDAPDGRRNLFVEPCGSMLTESLDAREENLSLLIYATNGMLAREEIREGGIKNPGTDFPDFVSFTNITRPTRPIQPPKNQEYLWSALSHLGAQYTTLADAPAFRALLSLYDWQHSDGTKRRIDAVTSVTAQPVERFINGSALRGIEFTITITESHFLGSGDIHLFGSVCKQVLSEQVSINTFLDLVIICKPSGTVLRWNSRAGNKCLI